MRLRLHVTSGRRRYGFLLGCALSGTIWFSATTAIPQVMKARPVLPATPVGVKPQLVGGGSVSLAATPSSVSFNLQQGGTAIGSSSVSITTAWNGVTGLAVSLNVYGFFSSATSALSDGATPADLIPSADIWGSVSGSLSTASGYTPFTQSTPFGGAACGLNLLGTSALLTLGATGSVTNALSLEIVLPSNSTLPAGTYTGTLTLEAQLL